MKASFIYLVSGLFIIFFCFTVQKVWAGNITYRQDSEMFSRAELARMLAPVALYPDVLLSQVLMASTYPIEVIEAERWVRKNPGLSGTDLDVTLLDKDWAPSVKALCHFPVVLELMSDHISQTADIGNAFLAQEREVMDVIQELRKRGYSQGTLADSPEQKILVTGKNIIIEPSDPRAVYVPYYDPLLIYGSWQYADYPPYSWTPSRVRIERRILFWPRYYLGYSFGDWSVPDWQRSFIYIDVHKRPKYIRRDRWRRKSGRWAHDPRHRHGVSYRETFVIERKDGHHRRAGSDHRDRRDSRKRSDSGFYVPDRKMPWDDKGSRYQVPDRRMPWEEDSARDNKTEKRERKKGVYNNNRHRQRESTVNQYRHRKDQDASQRHRDRGGRLRPLWNVENYSNPDDGSPPQRQSNDSPAPGLRQPKEGRERRDEIKSEKKSGGIKPRLRVR